MQELEAEQQQIQEERELLSRQKEAMKAEAGPVEQLYFVLMYRITTGDRKINEGKTRSTMSS